MHKQQEIKPPKDIIKSILTIVIVTFVLSLFFVSMNYWGPARKKYVVYHSYLWELYDPIPDKIKGNVQLVSGQVEEKQPAVFVISDRIQALDGKTGKFIWEAMAPGNVSNATFTGFGLLMGQNPLQIYSKTDGKIEREIKFDRKIISVIRGHLPNSILIYDGMEVSLYDITGEIPHWTRRMFSSPLEDSPGLAASKQMVMAGSRKKVFLLSSNSGAVKTAIPVEKGFCYLFPGSPLKNTSAVHLSPEGEGKNGQLILYRENVDENNQAETKQAWKIDTPPPAASPVVTRYMLHGFYRDQSGKVTVEGRSLNDGRQVWKIDLPGNAAPDQKIITGNDGGALMIIHPTTGAYWIDSRNGKELEHVTIPFKENNGKPGILTGCHHKWYLFMFDSKTKTLGGFEVISNQKIKETP